MEFSLKYLSLILCSLIIACGDDASKSLSVLVFTKTEGFRHSSIESGAAALETIAQDQNWNLERTESGAFFTDKNLSRFDTIVWLSTSGDVLDSGTARRL